MEPQKPQCPACGSEKWITGAELKTERVATTHPAFTAEKEIHLHLEEKGRKFWESGVVARSPMEARVCAACGYVSFFATNLPALREADAKINK